MPVLPAALVSLSARLLPAGAGHEDVLREGGVYGRQRVHQMRCYYFIKTKYDRIYMVWCAIR